MSVFLTKIQVNKIFHLEDILIEIDSKEKKHLILTGKNGSGKTSLLNSVAESLQKINDDKETALRLSGINERIELYQDEIISIKKSGNPDKIRAAESLLIVLNSESNSYHKKLKLNFNDFYTLTQELAVKKIVFCHYKATRKTDVTIPKSPEKPNLNAVGNIEDSKNGEFIKFLADLKIQEALARNENQIYAAEEIKTWFVGFTALLKNLFECDDLTLDFNYKDYSFTINQGGRKFGFNELSDGYSAIIDIIADLIIKMQDQNSLTRAYEKEGIVLIDEVETHLHLKLQRLILPMLTQIFPNIQFIVTTHSPFVLSSLDNAVAFDLEKRTRLENLTEYSYEALAEGYFKVETESNFLTTKLERFEELAKIAEKDAAEIAEFESLDHEFASMDDALASPAVKGQYLQIKLSAK